MLQRRGQFQPRVTAFLSTVTRGQSKHMGTQLKVGVQTLRSICFLVTQTGESSAKNEGEDRDTGGLKREKSVLDIQERGRKMGKRTNDCWGAA